MAKRDDLSLYRGWRSTFTEYPVNRVAFYHSPPLAIASLIAKVVLTAVVLTQVFAAKSFFKVLPLQSVESMDRMDVSSMVDPSRGVSFSDDNVFKAQGFKSREDVGNKGATAKTGQSFPGGGPGGATGAGGGPRRRTTTSSTIPLVLGSSYSDALLTAVPAYLDTFDAKKIYTESKGFDVPTSVVQYVSGPSMPLASDQIQVLYFQSTAQWVFKLRLSIALQSSSGRWGGSEADMVIKMVDGDGELLNTCVDYDATIAMMSSDRETQRGPPPGGGGGPSGGAAGGGAAGGGATGGAGAGGGSGGSGGGGGSGAGGTGGPGQGGGKNRRRATTTAAATSLELPLKECKYNGEPLYFTLATLEAAR